MAKFCVACGRPLSPEDITCGHCGKVLGDMVPPVLAGKAGGDGNGVSPASSPKKSTVVRPPFQWRWAFKSAGLTCVFIFVLAWLFGGICGLLFQGSDRLDEAAAAFNSLAAALSCFLGGGLAAFFSPGRTIYEPAVGAALGVVLLNLITTSFDVLILGWVIPFGLGVLGAKAGEYFQEIGNNRPAAADRGQ